MKILQVKNCISYELLRKGISFHAVSGAPNAFVKLILKVLDSKHLIRT